MTGELRPYLEYKESGFLWLGRIPNHWDCFPQRALFREIKNQGHENEPLLSVTISRGVIRQSDLLADTSKKDSSNLDKSKYKLVEPRDIAYNKMRAWQGAVGVSRYRGIVSPAYIVIRLRDRHSPDFFHYLFRTPGFAKEAERWSYGITSDQWSLRPEHFKMIYSCVPPRDEQDAIVCFLREMDRKVNRFIRNRRRLIELLNEQKQAIINRAVTRGLDPNVPMKPSGIDWLGEIPAHWEVLSLKRVCRMKSGKGITALQIEEEGLFPVYGGNGLRGYTNQFTHDGAYILVGRQGALCGNVHVVSGRFWASEHAVVVSLGPQVQIDWFAALLTSMNLNQYSMAAAQPGLAVERIVNLRIPLPSSSEQDEIACIVRERTWPLQFAVSRAEREIALIREFRARLIADVVTGKVDVRAHAPTESVLADEPIDDGENGAGMLRDEEEGLVEVED